MLKRELSPLIYFFISLMGIAIVFIFATVITYEQFSKNIIDNELKNQIKMAEAVDQVLNKYLDTFKFITKNAASQPAFQKAILDNDNVTLYSVLNGDDAKKTARNENINNILTDKRHAVTISNNIFLQPIRIWQLFKGLPMKDKMGNYLAEERRQIAKSLLKDNQDIHYVFETTPGGDVVFIEPYDLQKKNTSFNYGFRNSLRLVKKTKHTVVSEVYISNDSNRTQSIAIASPIFSTQNKLSGIFGLTLAAATIRDQIFSSLKKKFDVNSKMLLYLIDQHGHVVASSENKYVYYPLANQKNDANDIGNIRNLKILNNIKWKPDRFEKNSIWERDTAIWNNSPEFKIYQKQYKNINGDEVLGTFYPILIGEHVMHWGVLIETPVDQIFSSKDYLKIVFWMAGSVLALILFLLFVITIKSFRQSQAFIMQKQEEKEKEIFMLASQVAHDIRSPLITMEANLHILLKDFPSDKLLMMRLAVQRVRDIANNLLNQYRNRNIVSPHIKMHSIIDSDANIERYILMHSLIDQAISLKQYEWLKKPVELVFDHSPESKLKWIKAIPTEVNRVISNLLNNALEACEGRVAQIRIIQSCIDGFLNIEITDNGIGMSETMLNSYVNGASSKHLGGGLGLFSAKQYVTSIGGTINIRSRLHHGTTVLLRFPVQNPEWFPDQILLAEDDEIIILDDDVAMQSLWAHKLEHYPCKTYLFTEYNAAENWIRNNLNKLDSAVLLVDYELSDDSKNGLMLLKQYALSNDSYLITSHAGELFIQNQVAKLKIKMIPKSLVNDIHIKSL